MERQKALTCTCAGQAAAAPQQQQQLPASAFDVSRTPGLLGNLASGSLGRSAGSLQSAPGGSSVGLGGGGGSSASLYHGGFGGGLQQAGLGGGAMGRCRAYVSCSKHTETSCCQLPGRCSGRKQSHQVEIATRFPFHFAACALLQVGLVAACQPAEPAARARRISSRTAPEQLRVRKSPSQGLQQHCAELHCIGVTCRVCGDGAFTFSP